MEVVSTGNKAPRLFPRINKLYMDDTTNWASQRVELIKSGPITALEERYRSPRASLEKHLAEPTK